MPKKGRQKARAKTAKKANGREGGLQKRGRHLGKRQQNIPRHHISISVPAGFSNEDEDDQIIDIERI